MDNDKALTTVPFKVFPEKEVIDPYGSRKGRQSWGQIIQDFSKLTLDEVKRDYPGLLDKLETNGNLTLRQIVVARVIEMLIRDPNPAMLNLIMERGEGKVPQMVMTASGSVGDWVELANREGIPLDEVKKEALKIIEEQESDPTYVEAEYVE